MRTAVFGGSFDPPHEGHLSIAEEILKRGLADNVLFIPAWIPPHKQGRNVASFEDRLTMMKLAVSGKAEMTVSGIEGDRKGVSYTFDTLSELQQKNPGTEYVLVIGGDSLRQFHSWYRARELAEAFSVIVCPRPEETPDSAELLQHWPPNLAEKLLSGVIADFPLSPLSSTEIRKTLAKGKRPDGLCDAVWDWIQQRSLYMESEGKAAKPTSKELACFCAKVADDRKASNIVVIDMTEHCAIADFFIICTGTSSPHLRAISEKVQRDVRETYQLRGRIDGTPESNWMITDFGNVMVHVFTEESRNQYQLENLWGDAPRIQALLNEKRAVKSRLI